MALPTDPKTPIKSDNVDASIRKVAELEAAIVSLELRTASLTEAEQNQLNILRDKWELLTETLSLQAEELKYAQDKLKELEDTKATSKEIRDATIEALNAELALTRTIGAEASARRVEIKKQLDSLKEINKSEEKRTQDGQKLLGIFMSMTGQLGAQVKEMASLEGFARNVGSVFDQILASNALIAKETGLILERNNAFDNTSILEVEKMTEYGMSVEKLANAFVGLANNYSNFSNLNEKAKKTLVDDAAKMTIAGISADLYGKNLNNLTKVFGEFRGAAGVDLASKQIRTLGDTATKLGIEPKKMMNDFASSIDRLSVYSGPQAIKVFENLEAQSKKLGIEIGDLNGMVGDTFDQFESGAQAAGKLNAILGGDYLNSVEMLNATEDERVEILRNSLAASGKNFDSLDRYEKKAITSALGIKSVADASKLFSNQLDVQFESEKKLADVEKNAVTAVEKLKNSFSGLSGILITIGNAVNVVVDKLAEFNNATNGLGIPIASLVIGLLSFKGIFSAITGIIGGLFDKIKTLFTSTSSTTGSASGGIVDSLAKIGKAAADNAKGFLALGAAMLMFGGGIAIAALGIAKLVQAFSGLTGEQARAAMGAVIALMAGFAIGLGVLGLVGAVAAKGLLAAGFGMLILGAGVAIAAFGMSKLVESFKIFGGEDGKYIAENLYMIAGGVAMLSAALIGMTLGVVGLATFGLALAALVTAIEKLPESKIVSFKMATDSLKSMTDISKDLTPERVKPTIDVINASTAYYQAQINSKSSNEDALSNILSSINDSISKLSTSKEETEQKVELKVDGKRFGELVLQNVKIIGSQKTANLVTE